MRSMELDYIITEILNSRSIVISKDVNALLKLGFTLARIALERSLFVTIVDERGIASRYIPIELLDKVRLNPLLSDTCRERIESGIVIAILPRNIRILKFCGLNRLIVLSRFLRLADIPGYTKFYLSRIRGQPVFLLRSFDKGLIARVKFTSDYKISIDYPTGDLGKAYELLKNYLATYGEITIRDAVIAISKELGVDKKKARLIVVDLTKRGYIIIHKKKIELI